MPRAKPVVPPLNRRRNGPPVKEATLAAIEAQATVPAEQVIGEGNPNKDEAIDHLPAKSMADIPPPPKRLETLKARVLAHNDGRCYRFQLLPNGDVTVQQLRKGDLQAAYVMPRPEGDYLWTRLKGQGFTQF